MRKALITVAAVVACLIAAAVIMTIAYTNSEDYTSDVFSEGTVINGVNCSGLDYSQAAEELTDEWNSRTLVVRGKLGEKLAAYTDFGCTYKIGNQLKSVKKNHLIAAAVNHYIHLPFNTQIAMNVDKCGDGLAKDVKNSEFLKRGTVVETQNAYVDMEDPAFPIIPEVYGNKTDEDAYLSDILKAISLGNFLFEFDENSYLSMPEVKADDPELLKYQSFCQKYLGQKITYELGDETFTLTAEELDNLMKDDYSGAPDPEAVGKFVDSLKKDYDIVGGEQEFTSLTGKTFKVKGGDYGWIIDREGEKSKLMSDITSHKDVSRPPVFSQKGNGEYSRTLNLGDSYVDVDITKQHVVYFKGGKKKFECDCVSGCVAAGHSTPTGVYKVGYKNRNITLKGGGKKGSPGYYESFVSYWMAFIGNSIGLHDASWRSSFGGNIYKYSGSHGCVNLPRAKAGELYEILDVGTPVIVHY